MLTAATQAMIVDRIKHLRSVKAVWEESLTKQKQQVLSLDADIEKVTAEILQLETDLHRHGFEGKVET